MALLHAAFAAGVDLLDTADAYCRDDGEIGHNERLIARALAGWTGDRTQVRIATKGGLTRPAGRWVPDGRARQLRAACEASLRALGCARLDLYQLHAPDPRTPLATSVRALKALQRDGLVERIGLCNVSLKQLEEALRVAEIAAVQVELSLLHDHALWNGVAARCVTEGIPLLAYRPLGGRERGRRLARDETLAGLASRHGATPAEIALAWLRDLSPRVVPLPGATRPASVASLARARQLRLDDADREALDARVPAGRWLREGRPPAPKLAASADEGRAESVAENRGEVVLIMGLPGAGKSTLARELVARGYDRLNRDEAGGRLDALLPRLDELLAAGRRRVVLDNTYTTRKPRAAVVARAARHGVPVRCVWLKAGLEDAQLNAVNRMLTRYGRLLDPNELKDAVRGDPNAFGPGVLFRYERDLEPPDSAEGFSRVEVVPFTRRPDPALTGRALVVWLDGVVWRSRSGGRAPCSPSDLDLVAGRDERLRQHAAEGLAVFGLTWQPQIEAGRSSTAVLEACVGELGKRLGLSIEVRHCPHAAGPPRCWCRKPLPGLGAELVQRHHLDPARCLYVGASSLDRTFARRLGFAYQDAAEFFGPATLGSR